MRQPIPTFECSECIHSCCSFSRLDPPLGWPTCWHRSGPRSTWIGYEMTSSQHFAKRISYHKTTIEINTRFSSVSCALLLKFIDAPSHDFCRKRTQEGQQDVVGWMWWLKIQSKLQDSQRSGFSIGFQIHIRELQSKRLFPKSWNLLGWWCRLWRSQQPGNFGDSTLKLVNLGFVPNC